MSHAVGVACQPIEAALADRRYETARRLALAAIDAGGEDGDDARWLLHEALRHLGDLTGARETLKRVLPRNDDERLRRCVLEAEDFVQLSGHTPYRTSRESDEGLCYDEYEAKYRALARASYERAIALADTPERKRLVADSLRRDGRRKEADALAPEPIETPEARPELAACGAVSGRLSWADGSPVAGCTVTLGLAQTVITADPATFLCDGMGDGMRARFKGEQETRQAVTDADGRFELPAIPAQTCAFLAVTLDPAEHDVATHFVARDIVVEADATTTVEAALEPWTSAEPVPVADELPNEVMLGGRRLRKAAVHVLRNPFHFPFPRQLVCLPLPAGADGARLWLVDSARPDEPQPVQVTAAGEAACFLELPPVSRRVVALYTTPAMAELPALALRPDRDGTGVIETGAVAFRLPVGEEADALAPILAVRGEDLRWRGAGRLVLPGDVRIERRSTAVLEAGPVLIRVGIDYLLSTGDTLTYELTAHAGEAYLLVRETSVPLDGVAFEFSLREFSGGRGFLHWTAENGSVHWSTLTAEERELARLQESVAWWIPPQGFGYAMTADGLAERDYVGVFTRRRGEWIDREFERLAQGPGDDHRELDWPFPEMVGSTISMITAHTRADGDAFFRFGGFDGERQWGLLVSTLDRNDGWHKEISAVQHKTSSPRLQEFMTWQLDEQDAVARPFVVTRRERLRELRRKKESAAFAPVWEQMAKGHQRGPSRGLRALIDNDVALIWRLRCEMLAEAPVRARMTLFGRDYSDTYSPVGGRGITPFAEQYDLIAPTGVFTADEERAIRASLMLMGHLYMEEDFMNWRYNSRNANFEADRVDIVGAIGLAFHGNPDAERFVEHAASLMERSLNVYCTPGSGKWYENPACYYLHAASCRLNLAFHLHDHGILDTTEIARLRDFLGWGPVLLTAPYPHDNLLLRDGCSYDEYEAVEKVRRVPPIGDHAHLGQWVSEFFTLMGRTYRERDPDFADYLKWAYQEGGSNGGHFAKLPLFFCAADEQDLAPAPKQTLASRRLEGFGAVFRGNFGEPNEFYLLFKQGPGGYRYHRTEGSFLLMAEGRPLVFDGGEAGETWRHSTLSFYDTHMPLAPGHVERFASFGAADFVQGVHPKALEPGEPVFLSDRCEHTLVDVAYARYNEPNPAAMRSVVWVKDEYVVVHDDLRLPAGIPTHWHLQAVSDSHTGGAGAWRFKGRFGVDLQLLLPDLPGDATESVTQQPILEYRIAPEETFAMRHLQLSMTEPTRLTAILRPLPACRREVAATATPSGVRVQCEGIDDELFLSRDPMNVTGDVEFSGRYGAVLRRGGSVTLLLLAGERLAYGALDVTAESASVELTVSGTTAMLRATGSGRVTARVGDAEVRVKVGPEGVEQTFEVNA